MNLDCDEIACLLQFKARADFSVCGTPVSERSLRDIRRMSGKPECSGDHFAKSASNASVNSGKAALVSVPPSP